MKEDRTADCIVASRKKKIFIIVSISIVMIISILLTVIVWRWLASFSQNSFREYIQSFGALGWIVLLGLQILQVFVALIPGELLESAAGFIFGPLPGTAICYAGIVVGTAAIFFLTRKFGLKLVEVFVSADKINQFSFIRSENKLNGLVFLLFFIPGTPKDLITYFIGLTRMKFHVFLLISVVARFPSIITSTVGGHLLGEGKVITAVVLYSITAVISLAGIYIYNRIINKRSLTDNNDVKEGE